MHTRNNNPAWLGRLLQKLSAAGWSILADEPILELVRTLLAGLLGCLLLLPVPLLLLLQSLLLLAADAGELAVGSAEDEAWVHKKTVRPLKMTMIPSCAPTPAM